MRSFDANAENDRPTVPAPEPRQVSEQAPAGTHHTRFGAGRHVGVEQLAELVFGCSASAVFDYLGPQWTAYTGIPTQEQLGRSFAELLHEDDAERMRRAIDSAAGAECGLEIDVRIRRWDGAFRQFRVRAQLTRKASGGLRLCGSCTDIDDLVRKQQDLRVLMQALGERIAERTEHNERLARSNRELEQFASVVAHDLQEPLRAVAGYGELLQRRYQGQLEPAASELAGAMVNGAERMRVLIEDLLALARSNAAPRSFSWLDSHALLQAARQNLSLAFAQSAAVIEYGELPRVFGDATQLTQLFQNLLSNALKFRGGRSPQLQVSGEPTAQGACFAVRDNGIGIAAADLERIFAPLERLHTRSEYPGNGLGLSICRRIVARHGGRIWAESTPGLGSTFRFTLAFEPEPPTTGAGTAPGH